MMAYSRNRLLAGLALAFFPFAGWSALVIEGRLEATNNRFANDPSFIAGTALNGVGRSIDFNEGKWGTLVSSNVFISAYHYRPLVGNTLTFHATNDPTGPSESRKVIDARRMGTSDIWVGVLDSSLPPEYAPLDFYDQPLTTEAEFDTSSIKDLQAFMIGRWEDTVSLVTNFAVGQNLLEHWLPAGTFANVNQPVLIAVQDLPGDTDWFVPYEAWVKAYDSGAPLVVDLGGTLTVVGLNWLKISNLPLTWRKGRPISRNASGFSIVSNEAAGIQSAIAAFAVDTTAGYVAWMNSAFGTTDWAVAGPAIDLDGDGLDNFTEYAFVLDPANPTDPVPLLSGTTDLAGSRHLQAVFSARDDPDLSYTVEVGSDLAGWTSVPLSFDGSWSSTNPAEVIVELGSPNGDGTWNLTVRDVTALLPGTPRFIRVSAQ
ncbi:MAG: hypothetical protein AB3N33_09875 [Puniceicoccaceae bacterium]